jgi:pre-mRNA-processing factor 40
LQELVLSGKIKSRTKWKNVYPSFSDDERYVNLLGKPGSNPIELFWDVVDTLDQKLDAKLALIEGVLRKHIHGADKQGAEDKMDVDKSNGFVMKPDTEEGEFTQVLKDSGDEEIQKLTDVELKEVFHAVCHPFIRTPARWPYAS